MDPLQDRFLTVDEVAQRWGTSREPVRLAIAKKLLPARDFGHGRKRASYHIKLSDLLRYEDQVCTTKP